MPSFATLNEQVRELREFSANPQQRIRPGFSPMLDKLTRGPAPGEIYTILGRSYAGKSLVAGNIMVRNASKGSIFFSLEMPRLLALERLFGIWSEFPSNEVADFIQGNALPPLLDVMADELDRHVIVDSAGLSTWQMSSIVAEYADVYGQRPDFVLIDYLELVAGAKVSGDGWVQTESQAQQIKDFAKTENLPVFLIHQTNKSEPEWEPPTMGSARGGGYTESDFVIGMWRPYLDPKLTYIDKEALRPEIQFTILKNRPFGAHNQYPIRCRLDESLRIAEMV